MNTNKISAANMNMFLINFSGFYWPFIAAIFSFFMAKVIGISAIEQPNLECNLAYSFFCTKYCGNMVVPMYALMPLFAIPVFFIKINLEIKKVHYFFSAIFFIAFLYGCRKPISISQSLWEGEWGGLKYLFAGLSTSFFMHAMLCLVVSISNRIKMSLRK